MMRIRVHVTRPRKPGKPWRLVIKRGREHLGEEPGTHDEAESRRLAADLERDLNAGVIPRRGRSCPTVDEVLALRLAELEAADPPTASGTLQCLRATRASLAATIGELPVSELTASVLERARDEMLRTLSPNTVASRLGYAAGAIRWAAKRDICPDHWPKLEKLRAGETDKEPFSDEDVVRILCWMDAHAPQWALVFHILAAIGARAGEVLGLSVDDFDGEALTLRHQYDHDTASWKPLKSKHRRTVPLPRAVAESLESALDGRQGLIWTARHRRYPPRARTLLKILRQATKALGITRPCDNHSWRRAWISTASRIGIPDYLGELVTGHASGRGHYSGYRKHARPDLRPAVQAVYDERYGPWDSPRGGNFHQNDATSSGTRSGSATTSSGATCREALPANTLARAGGGTAPTKIQAVTAGCGGTPAADLDALERVAELLADELITPAMAADMILAATRRLRSGENPIASRNAKRANG